MAVGVLKSVLQFVFLFAVVLVTWGVHLATPGNWFVESLNGNYGPIVWGTHVQPVGMILVMCAGLASVLQVLFRFMRGVVSGGPRVGPLSFSVPVKVGWPTSRYRRRRVRGVP
jgi:hypothetical protein